MQIDSMCRQCLLCHPHQHPILPHGYCHGWLCGARPPAHMCRHDMFYQKYFRETDRLKKELAPTGKHSVTHEIFKSQKWCSKSWACSAISSISFLTPSWCQKDVNCGRQSSQSVYVLTFSGRDTPQHSWPAAATQNHDGMPIFGRMID